MKRKYQAGIAEDGQTIQLLIDMSNRDVICLEVHPAEAQILAVELLDIIGQVGKPRRGRKGRCKSKVVNILEYKLAKEAKKKPKGAPNGEAS